MKSSSAVLLATAGVAVAQNATLMTGPGPYPAEEAEIFENANQEASRSVPFSLWYPSESENPAPTWTWTVSVNQGSVPDSDVPNAAQLNTEYQFAWGEGDLQQAVAQYPGNLDQNNFCVTVVESLFPRGVLNNYDDGTEENASDGSCEGPLREHCMREILNALQDAERDENGCRAGTVDIAGIHQCEWSFEGEFQASTYNLLSNATADQAANETFPLSSGTGFAHITSDTFDGENRTFFNQQNTRLQMVIVDSGNTIETLCMRINTDNTAGSIQGSAVTTGINFWLIGATGIAALAYLL